MARKMSGIGRVFLMEPRAEDFRDRITFLEGRIRALESENMALRTEVKALRLAVNTNALPSLRSSATGSCAEARDASK